MSSRRFRVDRVRGVTVTQQTLLAVSLEGYSYKQMIALKEKVEHILNGMPPLHGLQTPHISVGFNEKSKRHAGCSAS